MKASPTKSVRCAIYARVSDDKGLDQDFVVFLLGVLRVAKLHQFARPIAVVATKPLARIVDAAILVALTAFAIDERIR